MTKVAQSRAQARTRPITTTTLQSTVAFVQVTSSTTQVPTTPTDTKVIVKVVQARAQARIETNATTPHSTATPDEPITIGTIETKVNRDKVVQARAQARQVKSPQTRTDPVTTTVRLKTKIGPVRSTPNRTATPTRSMLKIGQVRAQARTESMKPSKNRQANPIAVATTRNTTLINRSRERFKTRSRTKSLGPISVKAFVLKTGCFFPNFSTPAGFKEDKNQTDYTLKPEPQVKTETETKKNKIIPESSLLPLGKRHKLAHVVYLIALVLFLVLYSIIQLIAWKCRNRQRPRRLESCSESPQEPENIVAETVV